MIVIETQRSMGILPASLKNTGETPVLLSGLNSYCCNPARYFLSQAINL